jgi:hypothetical protein
VAHVGEINYSKSRPTATFRCTGVTNTSRKQLVGEKSFGDSIGGGGGCIFPVSAVAIIYSGSGGPDKLAN